MPSSNFHFVSFVLQLAIFTYQLPSVLSSSSQCQPSLDPSKLMRYGGDFASIPLSGANSTLLDCINLCCTTSNCVSFSYNNPQPSKSCIGSECCEPNGICCMLKNTIVPLVNNTYGPAVQTGTLSSAAPTPPFPNSTYITNVSFGIVSYWTRGSGDTWPTLTSENGTLYGWCCDQNNNGTFSPMSFYRIDGDPYNVNENGTSVLTPVIINDNALDYNTLCSYFGDTGSYPKINIKPAGALALPGNIFLTGVSCMKYHSDPNFDRQINLGGFIAGSSDNGQSWSNWTFVGGENGSNNNSNPMNVTTTFLSGRFAAPVFVSCGAANIPCSAKDNGYIYIFFPAGLDGNAYWDNNDAVYLARVQNNSILNPEGYEYYSSMDPLNPQWITDATQAQPVIMYGRMIGENTVFYNPYIQRYVIANFGFMDWNGNPIPWHQRNAPNPKRTQLILLEAPNPWGPWSIFYRSDNSNEELGPMYGAPGMYTPSFPSLYMQPVNTTDNTAQMVMFFACLDGATNCRYTLNWQIVTLTIQP